MKNLKKGDKIIFLKHGANIEGGIIWTKQASLKEGNEYTFKEYYYKNSNFIKIK